MSIERVEIGRAVLYHGDALEALAGMPDGSVDAIITDPPYQSLDVEVATGTTTRLVRRDEFGGKRLATKDGRSWFNTIDDATLIALLLLWRRLLTAEGATYVFADVKSGLRIFPALAPQNVIVWDKGRIGMGYSWRRCHEWIAYCPAPKHRLRRWDFGDLITVPPVQQKRHPTEKPVPLLVALIENSTERGGVVLDPFCGSGSAGAAAVQSGRRFIGVEADRRWFDESCRRIEDAQRQGSLALPQSEATA